MAARHVDVTERRLRPVYDALDNMDNKKAISQADKILKKQKDLHCAKVLKAIALLRTGKSNEAELLMQEVKKVEPSDDSTLQAMTICYREMGKGSDICEVYEMAVKQNPKNEEINTHLFMSYVRTSQFKKQQQVAMNLYKTFQKNPYYFWAVMSNVMQAHVCKDDMTKYTMFLTLAERMVEKFASEGRIDSDAEVVLYLLILEIGKKYEKALELIDGKFAFFLRRSVDIDRKRVELLTHMGKWSDVNSCYIQMIENSPEEWSFYKGYFESLFHLIEEQYSPTSAEGEGTARCLPHYDIRTAFEYIKNLKEKEVEKHRGKNRGPFLALLELTKQLHDRNLASLYEDFLEKPTDLVVEYFKYFGEKKLCFSDIVAYLDLIDEEHISEFLEQCKMLIPVPEESNTKQSIDVITRKICIEKFSRYLGCHGHFSTDTRILLAKQFLALHQDGLQYGTDLLRTDIQYSDDYALLASYLLLDCCEPSDPPASRSWNRVLLVLEDALKSSDSNYQMRLLLSRIYALLGAAGPCVFHTNAMDIKHIGHDTLGYNITRYAEPLGHFESAKVLYATILKLYQSNRKDTPEYIINSYKVGSFAKIFEMLKFKDRLENSFTHASVLYEEKILHILLIVNSLSSVNEMFVKKLEEDCPHTKENWADKLHDNRDLDILMTWDRSHRARIGPESRYHNMDRLSAEHSKKISYLHEILWLRLRALVLRALGMAVTMFKIDTGSTKNHNYQDHSNTDVNNGEDITDNQCSGILEELQNILREVDKCNIVNIEFPVCGPLKTRWKAYLNGSYDKLLVCLLKINQVLNTLIKEPEQQDEKLKESVELFKKDFTCVSKILSDNANWCVENLTVDDKSRRIFNGNVVEYLVLLAEAISIVLVFVTCYLDTILNIAQVPKNKKKKKSISPNKQELLNVYRDFTESLKKTIIGFYNDLVDNELLHLTEELIEFDINELYKLTDSSLLIEIWETLQKSYRISVREISGVIKNKVAFIKTLTL